MDAIRVAEGTGCPPKNVDANWALVVAALAEANIASENVQVAAAATIAVEASTFRPTRELRASRDRQPSLWALQERYWPSGFYGRGFIQLTWEENYRRAGKTLGIDLINNPDLALDPTQASRILAWFFVANGVDKLANSESWVDVRHKINGGSFGMKEFLAIVGKLKA